MASPFKTHETMDLARALLEDDSSPSVNLSNGKKREREDRSGNLDSDTFRALVVTKDSSTELIPTQVADSSDSTVANANNKPRLMMGAVRDLNAGKGMLDDDGKPAVGKVFSRVIQINSNDKPKQLKAKRFSAKKEEVVCSAASCSSNRERSTVERPQSSVTQSGQQRTSGPATINNLCPACNRQFSDETMRHHMVFCNGSSKEIM